MTEPAKPGSLREEIETRIRKIPGYENLDDVLHKIPEGERADYLAYDRRLIIEQKEQIETPEYWLKGREIEDLMNRLERKYRRDMMSIALGDPSLLTREERRLMSKLTDKFVNRQNKNAHKANHQIGSTKELLCIPDAVGVLLLIFDRLPGMMPPIILLRANRDLRLFANGKPQFPHIDVVLFSCRMVNMRHFGGDHPRGFIRRDNDNEEHKRFAIGILDALKGNKPVVRYDAKGFDPYSVQVLRPDIFAEPGERPNTK